MLIEKKYKEFSIYSYSERYIKLGEEIIDKKYDIVKKLKDTKRNYVAEIKLEDKNYILKEPRNEYIIPQRKLMTFFKKGEALTTLININSAIYSQNIDKFAEPFLAICKRKNRMIIYSSIVMEKISGIISSDDDKKDLMVELMKKIHEKGFYHGDFNPSNFIFSDNGIKIIDTQGKKMFFGKYRAHFDMLTMKWDSYKNMEYPYKKDIYYYLAVFIKKIKKIPFIEKLKLKKKNLREKGWKI